ncbi:MAG: metallophosphoesterase [Rhodospirillales bacterium]|nr:metallophosphoesterase [Rhodospirillales bacterium]
MMEALDLGEIQGPLLVFGGPYGNLQATEALLAEAARLGIPPKNMLCSGDLVAYCGDPKATVALIRAAGIPVVMGNCEEQLGSGAEDCGCGYAEGSSCDLMAAQWYRYASEQLDAETKTWMARLPRRILLTLDGPGNGPGSKLRLAAIHGGLDLINRFVFPATPAAEKAEQLALAGGDGVIGGHSGLPFSEIVSNHLWHNAGVIGLPANDGTPRVWYALLRPGPQGLEIEHRPLAYDHAAAAAAIRAADLPAAYAETLESGLWPADDVMPEADRKRRGRAIAPAKLVFTRDAEAVA